MDCRRVTSDKICCSTKPSPFVALSRMLARILWSPSKTVCASSAVCSNSLAWTHSSSFLGGYFDMSFHCSGHLAKLLALARMEASLVGSSGGAASALRFLVFFLELLPPPGLGPVFASSSSPCLKSRSKNSSIGLSSSFIHYRTKTFSSAKQKQKKMFREKQKMSDV